MYLKTAILNAKGLEITSARFLNPDPAAHALKDAYSVVATTTPEKGKKMGTHIFLLSRKREIKVAHSANKTTLCRNCQRYRHTAPVCKYDHPVYPICALHHKKAEHHCPTPTSPKEGNLHPVTGCCSACLPHCTNCGDDHPATDPSCPASSKQVENEPAPPGLAPFLPPPEEREMDTSEDEANVAETTRPPAQPTALRPLPAFEVVTPRSARPFAPPSVARPTTGTAGPLP